MYLLPVVERELRVATRKRATYRLRLLAAFLSLVIGTCLLLIHMLSRTSAGQLGPILFGILTWLAFIACISAGVFYTSDCISEEKREGTLGFLFLTDLRGIDVVLGKIMATSLRSAFAVLAIFPVLGLTLLMGGVSGKQFWQTSVALVLALACSLTAGVFVSTFSRQANHAASGTFILLVAWLAAGPVLDLLLSEVWKPGLKLLSFSSPGFTFGAARAGGSRFGAAVLGNGLSLMILLGAASFFAPRTWQEKPAKSPRRAKLARVSPAANAARQRRLDRNPFLWLASRERWQGLGAWIIAGIGVLIFASLLIVQVHPAGWAGWNATGGLLVLLLYVWLASQASRLFLELRKNGVLELLVTTPLKVDEIVQGQWLALLRTMGPPVVLLLLAQTIGVAFAFRFTWGTLMTQTGQAAAPAFSTVLMGFLAAGAGSLAILANLAAVSWFGMWSGLTAKTNNQAALKTILWVQVLPWFVISFLSSIVTMMMVMPNLIRSAGQGNPALAFTSSMFPVLSVAVPASLAIAKDVFFIHWSRNRLRSRLRERVTAGVWLPTAPITRLTPAPPPVIPATG